VGITQILGDSFYRKLDPKTFRMQLEPGQIVWVPTPFREGLPRIMEVERNHPQDHFASKFSVHGMTENDFKKHQKLPIKLLNLEITEELVVTRCKMRPAILLLTSLSKYDDIAGQLKNYGRKHLEEDSVMVIPLYSVQKAESDTGFPPIMSARIRSLMYHQLFYCPAKDSGLPNDNIARLDRLFAIRPIHPALQPTDKGLSDDAFSVLTAMLRLMLRLAMNEKEYELFKAFRDLALETLPPEAQPKC
jgi:hypothetical protein